MKKRRQGFTLIELLAVIVILGLLMAIAIPSVTKYITQSRKKTVTTTIGNYIGALTNQVNDMEYIFTATNTVYAVPIECISLERGGTDPFGEWMQASNAYWAYVLVQYDDSTSSYTYGFTFKDSAGYGLYPTTSEKLKESGSQINTDIDLNQPKNGTIEKITSVFNWNGFNVDATTNLKVLEAEVEGTLGDGVNTCTLCQKGSNYDAVEQEKETSGKLLSTLIKEHNPIITTAPTLTKSSNNTSDASGLYSSNETTNGQPTYYFRGNVQNNNVRFAGLTWKIVRINEDGTVRLIMQNAIDDGSIFEFSDPHNNYKYMYYSNGSNAKTQVDNWYESNLKDYESYIAMGTFCEQAKVGEIDLPGSTGNVTMVNYTSYKPNFKCVTDENGKGVLNLKVGLITIDEVIYAGGYFYQSNSNYYLTNAFDLWTMSPAGFDTTQAYVWVNDYTGGVYGNYVYSAGILRPVINLTTGALATGTGTSADPYVIQTN